MIKNKSRFSYDMIADYHFVNKDIDEVYSFIEKYFVTGEFKDVMKNANYVSSLLNSFHYFAGMDGYMVKMNLLLSNYEKILDLSIKIDCENR